MKKRLIAFALTLAMVVSSLAMFSFVSFGAEEDVAVAAETPKQKLYAYMGTNKVDGAIDADEPFTARTENLLPKVSMSTTWDYDNVYIYIYQWPFHGNTDYLNTLNVNIGGAQMNITDWENNGYTASQGAKVVTSSTSTETDWKKDETGEYVLNENGKKIAIEWTEFHGFVTEFSLPLSEMSLDADAYSKGVLSFPMTLSLGAVADGKATDVNKEYDLILSGRSIIGRTITANGSDIDTNGYSGFNSTGAYSDSTSPASVVSQGITRGGTNHGTFTVVDANTSAAKIRIFGAMNNIVEYISCQNGGSTHISFELNIKNLPIDGTVAYNDGVSTYNNTASTIAVYGGGRTGVSSASGVTAHIYNTANGLMIAYYNGTSTPGVKALGVSEGEAFRLGFNELPSGKIEILVNEEVIVSDARAVGIGATSSIGFFWITSKRGNNNGYSLDNDKDGKISAEEQISFTVRNFTLCALNEVDVKSVASKTKQGGASTLVSLNAPEADLVNTNITADNALTASGKPGDIGSISKAYASYSISKKVLYLTLTNVNVDRFDIIIAGQKLSVSYNKPSARVLEPVVETSMTGVAATMDSLYTRTLLAIPLDQINATVRNKVAACDISITATREYQIVRNPGTTNETKRLYSSYSGSARGSIVFEYANEKSVVEPTLAVMTSFDYGSSKGESGGKITFTKSNAQRSFSQNVGVGAYCKNNKRVISFNFNPTAMQAYAKNTIKAEPLTTVSATASPQDRVRFILGACWSDGTIDTNSQDSSLVNDKGAFAFTITNTTDGGSDGGESLVIVHTNRDGTITIVPLDKKVGETVSIKMVWDIGNSGAIYVDGVSVLNFDDVRCAVNHLLINNRNTGFFHVETYRPNTSSTADFAHTITDITVATYTPRSMDTLLDLFKNKGAATEDFPISLDYIQESKPVDGKYSVRFTSSIESLAYGKAGYEIAVFGANKTVSMETRTVYKKILANTEAGLKTIEVEKGKYFVTLDVGNIPVDRTMTFVVKPYVTVEGVRYYGQGYTVKYSNGEYAGCSLFNGVITVPGDTDPFYDGDEVITDNIYTTFDENFNSLVYDMGKVTDINRAKLTTRSGNIDFFNKSFAGIYYSDDGKEYKYLSGYSVFQNGTEIYLYNFNVNARYIKINTTKNNDYLGDAQIENYSQYMFSAEYSDAPLLASDDFAMTATVQVKNNTAEAIYDEIREFTLATLGINASDLKSDMSDIRFMCDGMCLPHYYSNGVFYVRILKLAPYETVTITVRYNSDTAIDVSNGEETFEIQYGNKYLKDYNASPWQNSVATMPNGDILKMGYRSGALLMNRSTDGGATWTGYQVIPGTEVVTHGGGFIVDNKTGTVFYMALEYYGDPDSKDENLFAEAVCEYMIYKSTDNGYTWTGPIEVSGFEPPEGAENGNRYYAISYSDGITLSTADGDGEGVDYVFSTGFMLDKECNFCTTAFYSKDGGATWQASETKINFTPSNYSGGSEMGLSEETIFEQPDGTLVIYARCQLTDGVHFAISRSTDKGVTWSQPSESDGTSFSNIYAPNTQPIIEKLNGNPVFMWGGNNVIGGRSYSRFPMNLASTDDFGNTFTDIIDLGFQTQMGILDNYHGNYDHYAHTNPDLTFYNYGGADSLYLVTCKFEMYVRDIENLLLKTKGAFDSFEYGSVIDRSFVETDSDGNPVTRNHFDCLDGWTTSGTTSSFSIGTLGATDGNYALSFGANSIVSRTLHYMEKGKISFDYYLPSDFSGSTTIELQSGFSTKKSIETIKYGILNLQSRQDNTGAAPIVLDITSDGSIKYYSRNASTSYPNRVTLTDTGIDLTKGSSNSISIEFDGNAGTASITVNGTTKTIAYMGEVSGTTYKVSPSNFICNMVVHNGASTTAIDRFTAVKQDVNLTGSTEAVTTFPTKNAGVTVSSGTITYSDSLSASKYRGYAINTNVQSLKHYSNNNVIEFNINVNSMVDVAESYLVPEQHETGWTWDDSNCYVAPRVVIGATRPNGDKLDYEDAMCLTICNISGKGLVVVATYSDGKSVWCETAELGKKAGENFKMTVVWEANYGDLHVCVEGEHVATFKDYKYISGDDYGMFSGNPGVLGFNFCRTKSSKKEFKVTISDVKVTQY